MGLTELRTVPVNLWLGRNEAGLGTTSCRVMKFFQNGFLLLLLRMKKTNTNGQTIKGQM